ncbi:MAG: hypothetical protein R6U37_00560 [Dehalococcoidia bacterium]
MGDFLSRLSDSSKDKNAEIKSRHLSSICPICGRTKVFNLCPVCNRNIIKSRQARLEAGLRQTLQTNLTNRKQLEKQIQTRDLLARRELSKHGNARHYLLQSLLFGCVVAIPMLVMGLQMSIQNIIRPLGVALSLAGIGFLTLAIHRRIIYDSIQNARKWLNLSSAEKLNYAARLQKTTGSQSHPAFPAR